jgi:benzoyl-CoA oxygenase/reductase BoxA protein
MSTVADSTDAGEVLKQHLIDPEICIRCNTCEETCPVDAITHDSRNYVVDASKCNSCMACISPCPTGSIDNWRTVLKAQAYSTAVQLTWDELPAASALATTSNVSTEASAPSGQVEPTLANPDAVPGSQVPPWSASHPYVNLYGTKNPITATVSGNYRVTDEHAESDTRHIVLDFGDVPFPVLEGQSIGILPPGLDAHGRPHKARQYSIASPRDGERAGYNNVALTVKRVLKNHEGVPAKGYGSNYVCDLKKGDTVQVIGPFGTSFLMPNHAGANLLMICTGTGSAPMRAMTERRRRARASGKDDGGKLMLFFGARTQAELPYFGPLLKLPTAFIDTTFVFSREGPAKRYVQDALRARAGDVAALLRDANTYVYVCGLKGMETGVLDALCDVAKGHGMDWTQLHAQMKREGRLQLETY